MTKTTLAGETGKADRPLRALWFDLETTGSDRTDDHVLEIGAALHESDYPFKQLAGPWRWVVRPTADDWTTRMIPVVVEMHAKNGLLAEVFTDVAIPLAEAESALVANLAGLDLRPHEVVMAGSGVAHFDKGLVDTQMPKLAKWLKYWCIDVGNVRRFLIGCGFAHVVNDCKEQIMPDGDKLHRSVGDLEMHVAEASYYGQWLREIAAAAGQPAREHGHPQQG